MTRFILKNKEIELTDEEVAEIIKQNSKPIDEKKVGLEIKNRFTGEIIYTSTKTTWKEAVEEAVSKNADLRNANLLDANLENANLENANLENANLENANLENANLWNADLWNAKFYGKGGELKLTKEQVPVFLKALGFIIEE